MRVTHCSTDSQPIRKSLAMSNEEQTSADMEHNDHDGGSSDSVVRHTALLYAVCLTLVGFLLPLSSYVSLAPFSPWSLAGFYIGIYAVSIVFIIFFIGWLIRRPPTTIEQDDSLKPQRSSTEMEPHQTDSLANVNNVRSRHRQADGVSGLTDVARKLGVREIPACSQLSQEESRAPSFFMRIACFIFGALKVTHEALMIVDALTDVTGGCNTSSSESAGLVIQYVLSICFTVLQTFFIFKYSKLSVNACRKVATLGFMHLVATNLCDWFLATLMETSHSVYKTASRSSSSSYSSSSSNTSCSKDMFWRMAPYLLPFTIEYALMAAVSAYALAGNVGRFLMALHLPVAKGSSALLRCLRRCRRDRPPAVSCARTGRGIAAGSILFIAAIVSGIYFTVYINDKPNNPLTSQLIYQITDLVLLSANLVLCIVAYCKMRRLSQHQHGSGTGPDAWLLGITLIGVLAFQLFQLFGSWAEEGVWLGLRVSQALLSIVQTVFQVFVIFEVEHRRCESASDMPGREELAALMLGNVALWIVYTLEIREINFLPTYSDAYQPVATDIVTYTCSPLIIFFRFHSACCFAEIWRVAYKTSGATAVRRNSTATEELEVAL